MRHQATEMRSVRQLEQDLFLRRNANFSDGVELRVHEVSAAWTTPCTASGARVVSNVVFRRVSRTATCTRVERPEQSEVQALWQLSNNIERAH